MNKKSNLNKKQLKAKKNTAFGGVVDKISYKAILKYICFLILGFAILFWVIDFFFPKNGTNLKESHNFFDYLYFSVITFSTLGYGDISPSGFGKLLAVLEVLSGMFLFAIFIGKISSERQSTKLTLIYSSISHRRILDFVQEVREMKDNLDEFYTLHDNKNLLYETGRAYDLVSIIRKYLVLQSLEGELAEYGNDSTLRRLYQAIYELQKTLGIIRRTVGVQEKSKIECTRTIDATKEVAKKMQQFHVRDEKIIRLLKEIERNANGLNNTKPPIHRTEITQELLNVVSSYRKKYDDLSKNYKEIADDLGMTYKLCLRCIKEIKAEKVSSAPNGKPADQPATSCGEIGA